MGEIFHSDRGKVGAYTSAVYRAVAGRLGVGSSMGRTRVCWDSVLAQFFFSGIKDERAHRAVYAAKAQAKRDVIMYLERF